MTSLPITYAEKTSTSVGKTTIIQSNGKRRGGVSNTVWVSERFHRADIVRMSNRDWPKRWEDKW